MRRCVYTHKYSRACTHAIASTQPRTQKHNRQKQTLTRARTPPPPYTHTNTLTPNTYAHVSAGIEVSWCFEPSKPLGIILELTESRSLLSTVRAATDCWFELKKKKKKETTLYHIKKAGQDRQRPKVKEPSHPHPPKKHALD